MVAPPKPWEMAAQQQQQQQMPSCPSSNNTTIPPQRPARTWVSQGNNSHGGPLYSPYGGNAGHVGYGSGSYSGYSGNYPPRYNSGYGFNYGGSAYGDRSLAGGCTSNEFVQAAEEGSRAAFQSVEALVHAFGSIAMMLESTFHATHSSFRAVLGVADQFSRLRQHLSDVFSIWRFVRFLRSIAYRALVALGIRIRRIDSPALNSRSNHLSMSESIAYKEKRSLLPLVCFFVALFGAPWAMWRLLQFLASNNRKVTARRSAIPAIALYEFFGETREELSFAAGERLLVILDDDNNNSDVHWVRAVASDGRRGFVPQNYLSLLSKESKESSILSSQPRHNSDVLHEKWKQELNIQNTGSMDNATSSKTPLDTAFRGQKSNDILQMDDFDAQILKSDSENSKKLL